MDKVKAIAVNGLEKYYNILFNYGHVSTYDTNQLVAYLLIDDLLSSVLEKFITEADMRGILKFASCLLGTTCLLPMSAFNCTTAKANNVIVIDDEIYMITQDGLQIVTEFDNFPIVI